MNSKILWLLIISIVAFAIVIAIRSVPNMYKMLPAQLDKTMPVTPYEDWREYQSKEGNFKVFFPTIPQHATENLPEAKTKLSRKYDMYVAERMDGAIFMISLITYIDPIENPKKTLRTVLDEMLALNPKNKLENVQETTFKNHEALDFLIRNPDVQIQAKIFVVKNTIYLISYIAQSENYQKEDFDHFLGTFQLLK